MSVVPQGHLSIVQQFDNELQSRTLRVGIIGLGYVGLPLALLFNEQKSQVTGFDIDKSKVDTLNGSGSYIYRIPSTEIQAARQDGFRPPATFASCMKWMSS